MSYMSRPHLSVDTNRPNVGKDDPLRLTRYTPLLSPARAMRAVIPSTGWLHLYQCELAGEESTPSVDGHDLVTQCLRSQVTLPHSPEAKVCTSHVDAGIGRMELPPAGNRGSTATGTFSFGVRDVLRIDPQYYRLGRINDRKAVDFHSTFLVHCSSFLLGWFISPVPRVRRRQEPCSMRPCRVGSLAWSRERLC
jgi:hypothetical protein